MDHNPPPVLKVTRRHNIRRTGTSYLARIFNRTNKKRNKLCLHEEELDPQHQDEVTEDVEADVEHDQHEELARHPHDIAQGST